ncbi:MAG: hypothetical protein ACI9XO_000938 [Paraglaciecola sp.]|jgi:hypothetical protein
MNFPLKNLEQHLPEMSLILGEQLYEQGFVGNLKQLEHNLWVAKVVDKEVEIQISPTKVKACTCECAIFKEKKLCEHIGAMLLALRKEKERQKVANPPKIKRKASPKRLTVASILDNAPPPQVYSFLKAYAKTNKQFSLALKARFAGAVPMNNIHEKYRQLLEASIKGNRLTNGMISYRGWQQLVKLCKELMGQSDDAIALENFQEGAMILQSVIEKITPVIGKSKGDETILKEVVEGAFFKLEELLKAQPAPDLREVIWDFCLQESTKATYRAHDVSKHFFELMHLISDDNEKIETLLESIDNELIKKTLAENYRAHLLILKFNLLDKSEVKTAIDDFISDNISTPNFLVFVIKKSLENKEIKRAKTLAQKGLKQRFSPLINIQIEYFLLEIALVQKSQAKIVHYAYRQFLAKKDFRFYHILKENYTDDWAEKVEQIFTEITKMPFSMLKRDVQARIYVEEKRWSDLLRYIENFKSINLLQRYDKLLLINFRKEIKKLYIEFIHNYLTNHLGRKPAIKTKEILLHLFDIGEAKLASQIVRQLRKDFAERESLLEELEMF